MTVDSHELDLKYFSYSIRRNWKWSMFGSFIGLLSGTLWTLVTPQVWKGEFQIVLVDKDNKQTRSMSSLPGPLGSKLAGIGSINDLETERMILISPSILRPVFEKNILIGSDNSQVNTYKQFLDWSNNNVDVSLVGKTPVLSVTYLDTNKNLITSVLRDIAASYKEYSKRDKVESIDKAIRFSEDALKRLKEKSARSSKILDTFAIKYGISANGAAASGGSRFSLEDRLERSSSVRANSSPQSASSSNSIFSKLSSINEDLIKRRQFYTDKDPKLSRMVRERDALQKYAEITAGGIISNPVPSLRDNLSAQEIVLEFNQIQREAARDVETLASLESSLMDLRLEKSRMPSTWEVISEPVVFTDPVSPLPGRFLATGLFVGLLAGSGLGLINEKCRGVIYTKDQMASHIKFPLLLELPLNNQDLWSSSLQVLVNNRLKDSSVALRPLGQEITTSKRVLSSLSQCGLSEIAICMNSLEAEKYDAQILLCSSDSISSDQLKKIIQELSLQTKPPIGWIWFFKDTQ